MNRILFLRPLLLLAVAVTASLFMVVAVPALARADSVSDGLNQLQNQTGNAYPTTVFGGKKTPSAILGQIIQIALGIAFAVAVIMVIYGGFQYITSAGNEEKATDGRRTLVYALIGLVIILLSFVIVTTLVNFINNRGTTTNSGSGTPTGGTNTTNNPPKPPIRNTIPPINTAPVNNAPVNTPTNNGGGPII
jgi:hypothetical protein